MYKRFDILLAEPLIKNWIIENRSKSFICKQLKCKPETLAAYLKELNIVYAGNKGNKGFKSNTSYLPAKEYINSTCVHSHVLKEKLIRDGIKEDKCELCGVSIWNGVKLALELHHKDCNHFNNSLDNLQILCPNCHSIQVGNCGANIGKYAKLAESADASGLDPDLVNSNCEFESRALHQTSSIDELGRQRTSSLSVEDWKNRLNLILNSGVDLTKFGWKADLQRHTNLTRRQIDDTVLYFYDDLRDKIYIRKNN